MSELFATGALGQWHLWGVISLFCIGLHVVVARDNLLKKITGLSMMQIAVIFFYVTIAKVRGGTAPIIPDAAMGKAVASTDIVYRNPIPHVLMLTAIVVGIATTAVALGLVVRIHESFGTLEEDEIEDILYPRESAPTSEQP